MTLKVKKYKLEDIEPGMVLARDILSAQGVVILNANTVLTETMLGRMAYWGFWCVDVYDTDYTVSARHKLDKDAFYTKYITVVKGIKQAFECARYTKKLELAELMELSHRVVDQLSVTKGVINYLYDMKLLDDYTFQHSVNVAILGGIFGRWMGLENSDLQDLVFAGLLHDVGKMQIPLEILNKPGRLSPQEMEVIKRHPGLGYVLLKDAGMISNAILQTVWQHHERLDGSGYPRNLSDSQIQNHARIIAIADIYDAMTADRVYRSSVTPFVVIETLRNDMYDKLDPAICAIILNYLQDFFIGNVVVLNDGRKAEVIYVDKAREFRPVVRTIDGEYINLETEKKVTIVKVLAT